jgi:hypothetical protein
MNMGNHLNAIIVIILLDMLPTDEELIKVFKFYKEYSKLGVYEQQRIDMFNYIREHWND